MGIDSIAAMTLASVGGLVIASYAIEALRSQPTVPAKLPWGGGISMEYADIGGIRVRYIRTGKGPNLVLLHTLRTQLDLFQGVIPLLAEHFTVYAYDYPGHGWSDIPQAAYAPEDFYRWTAAFLETLDIRGANLVGISIGGTIALVLAAQAHPYVARAIAINAYDYPPAGGIRESSVMARLILGPANVPILGATIMRLRNRWVSDRIMEGGVACPDAIPEELEKELHEVGSRPRHYQAFLNLLKHEQRWSQARDKYPRIKLPTLLVYGDQDWAPLAERERTRALIPGVAMVTLRDAGHFLSLDQPTVLTDLVIRFVSTHDTPARETPAFEP